MWFQWEQMCDNTRLPEFFHIWQGKRHIHTRMYIHSYTTLFNAPTSGLKKTHNIKLASLACHVEAQISDVCPCLYIIIHIVHTRTVGKVPQWQKTVQWWWEARIGLSGLYYLMAPNSCRASTKSASMTPSTKPLMCTTGEGSGLWGSS